MAHPRRPLSRITLVLALLLVPPAAYAGYQVATGNVHEVDPGVYYRSGQLGGDALQALIASKNIRTIVNLRGAHSEKPWYAAEKSIADGNGVNYISFAMSSVSQPDMTTMMRLAAVLRDAPKPILVHCSGGANRTGLASAIFLLAAGGKTEEEALRQLSVLYGHFPWFGSRTSAMDEAFAAFAAASRTAPSGRSEAALPREEAAR